MDKAADDFDEFLALEKMAEKHNELERILRPYASIFTWDHWNEYKTKMRMRRSCKAAKLRRQFAQNIHKVRGVWLKLSAFVIYPCRTS